MQNGSRKTRAVLTKERGVWRLTVEGPEANFIIESPSLYAVKTLAKYKLIERGFTLAEAQKLIKSAKRVKLNA